MVSYAMKELSDQIGGILTQGGMRIDFATRAHLSETKSQIDRTLNAPHIQMPGGGGSVIILGQPAPGN
jgi:hypothetical protein